MIMLLLLPIGIKAKEQTNNGNVFFSVVQANNNEEGINPVAGDEVNYQVINRLEQVPNLSEENNIKQEIVVIYNNSGEANVNDLSLTTDEVVSGERVSDRVDVIEVSENANVDQIITELEDNPSVLAVDKNGKIEVSALPNDPYINEGSAWQFEKIGVDKTWDKVLNTEPIVVAVIDTGLNVSHPDIMGNTVNGYDYVADQQEVVDLAGHGTEVSGCIAAVTNNGIGTAGIAGLSNIKIAPYRTGGKYDGDNQLDVAYICAALMDAADRPEVKVINMSFGGYGEYSSIKTAIEYAANAGKILVASAGNEGNSSDAHAGEYSYPASYENVISVSATTQINERATFSQYNDKVDLCAPGNAVLTTNHDGSYSSVSGTSFSSPIVAGCCAVLLAADENLMALQVENILKDTALDLGDSGKDNYFGNGLVQLDAALETITPTIPLNLDRFITDKPSSQEVNADIQVSATASGGEIPYEYKFYYQKDGVTVLLNDFSADSTITFTPLTTGIYILFVDVKDVKGTIVTKKISDYVIVEELIKFGDVDGNSYIKAFDALLALQMATGKNLGTSTEVKTADVNRSGVVEAYDALRILQYATGKISVF